MSTGLRTHILRGLEARASGGQITVSGRRGASVTYTGAQVLAEAEQRELLWEQWLGKGPHVLVSVLPAGEEFLFTLIASFLAGGTLVPVASPRATDPPGRLRHIVRTCGARAVLCTATNRERFEAMLRDENGVPLCTVLAADDPDAGVHECAESCSPDVSRADPSVPIIQHTSGSTRFPKAVPIGASQILANCALIQQRWGMNEHTVMVNWLPHYHDMGLMGGIVYPLLSGAHSVQMSPFEMIRRPASWLEAISAHHATFSGGPPFAFLECLNRIGADECEGLDLSSWQRAFCGAETVPAGLLDRFADRFESLGLARSSLFACYGMAEYTLFCAGEPGDTTPGADVPEGWDGVEPCRLSSETRANIRISDPQTGERVEDGRIGEIWLRGPSVGRGYLGQPEETDATFENEAEGSRWLRSGDLGGICGESLHITGRLKDIVIVHGRNIAAAEIEWLAAELEPALNPLAAAAFMPEGCAGGHANLFIELRPGAPRIDAVDELIARMRRVVAGGLNVILDDVRILARGALPRTTSGKIRRQQVAALFAEGEPFAVKSEVAR